MQQHVYGKRFNEVGLLRLRWLGFSVKNCSLCCLGGAFGALASKPPSASQFLPSDPSIFRRRLALSRGRSNVGDGQFFTSFDGPIGNEMELSSSFGERWSG